VEKGGGEGGGKGAEPPQIKKIDPWRGEMGGRSKKAPPKPPTKGTNGEKGKKRSKRVLRTLTGEGTLKRSMTWGG